MTGLTHLALSSVIYRRGKFPVPVLLAAGFAAHFFLDRIPHFELGLWLNVLPGVAGGGAIFYLARRDDDPLLPAAALIGLLPDGLVQTGVWPWFDRFHAFCHFRGTGSPLLLVLEFVLTAGCFFILWRGKKGA